MQIARFNEALAVTDRTGGRPPYIHTACTAAALLFAPTHFTMLRTGIGLYGLWPSRETFISCREKGGSVPDFRPVLSWKTRLVQKKLIPEGTFVGYGCSYRTTRPTVLGVLPVGYADGYDRALGNRAHVLIRGRRAPVIGRICMNLTMIDLTDVPGAGLEEEVVLLGRSGDERISAETMAEWAGTINYEIVTRISSLAPRRVV
jgi:alanine racemase